LEIHSDTQGVAVNGNPDYSWDTLLPQPSLAGFTFAFSDNFYLEPSVSSDGHRWLTNTYTTEFEQTHWPHLTVADGRCCDDPAVYENYPGAIGFTDANSSPDPQDYNQHGGFTCI